MRQRHAVWERWLQQGAPVQQVLRELGQANFDPEFFCRHERAIRRAFDQQFPDLAPVPVAAAQL